MIQGFAFCLDWLPYNCRGRSQHWRPRMVRIDHALGVVKTEAHKLLDATRILELCREFGYQPEADGKLDPATLVALFLQQIADGNLSCDHVRLIGGDAFSASGYCQARE